MPSTTILYDLPSQDPCRCWSLNPWKTRLALNYKSIPYTTSWTEYPDIASKYESLNITPNETGFPYTIPGVSFPDGTHMQDSRPIADKLEQMQPEPSLRLDAPVLDEVQKSVTEALLALAPVLMPKVPRNVLNPRSVERRRRRNDSTRLSSP